MRSWCTNRYAAATSPFYDSCDSSILLEIRPMRVIIAARTLQAIVASAFWHIGLQARSHPNVLDPRDCAITSPQPRLSPPRFRRCLYRWDNDIGATCFTSVVDCGRAIGGVRPEACSVILNLIDETKGRLRVVSASVSPCLGQDQTGSIDTAM